MRSFRSYVAGCVLAGLVIMLAPGCDSGPSAMEKAPADVKPGTLKAEDMPGYKGMQDAVKKK